MKPSRIVLAAATVISTVPCGLVLPPADLSAPPPPARVQVRSVSLEVARSSDGLLFVPVEPALAGGPLLLPSRPLA